MFPRTLVCESPKYLEGEVKLQGPEDWWFMYVQGYTFLSKLHITKKKKKKDKLSLKYKSFWIKLAKIAEIIFGQNIY